MWIGNLEGWAATIAANLADHGFFYFLDAHPTAMIFDEASVTPVVSYDYFHSETPLFESGGRPDYADGSYMVRADAHSFTWSVSDIFASLENQGLAIHEVREYPFAAWPQFPDMKKAGDGYWHRPRDAGRIPMLLGFKARRQPPGAVS